MAPAPSEFDPQMLRVLKVSGHELDQPAFLSRLAAAVAALAEPAVLVHGGGKEISAALEQAGIVSEFMDGMRVTSLASMHTMEMVVCGSIGKRIARTFVGAGIAALSLSGVDLGLLRCVPYRPDGHDLQQVGQIVAVAHERLQALLAHGWLPIIAPVALGIEDLLPYNVNADYVAHAIAAALAPHHTVELTYISILPGVLQHTQLLPRLTPTQAAAYIADGTIYGGMIPKVQAALAALQDGISSVRITDLDGLSGGGTRFVPETAKVSDYTYD